MNESGNERVMKGSLEELLFWLFSKLPELGNLNLKDVLGLGVYCSLG